MSQPNPAHSLPAYDHALVIGSSMAGLLAARVLSGHFARVTVLDRDELSGEPAPRKGVPQSRHPHALLRRGQDELELLFPGISEELLAAGALPTNLGRNFYQTMYGQTRTPYDSAITILSCSRPLIESTVYRHVRDLPNVEFRTGSLVVGLLAADGAVTGVQLRGVDEPEDAPTRSLAADLVLDASGRPSQAPEWLAVLGFPTPEEQVISASLSYTSRMYKRPADVATDLHLISVMPFLPHNQRGGIMTALEGDRLHLTQFGMLGDHAPTDDAGYLEFARSLCDPIVYNIISQAEPLSPILSYRRVENRWRRYDLLPRHLEGFLVMGDAAMALNPVFGQGMTVAAISAGILEACLRERRTEEQGLDGLAAQFQPRLTEATQGAWQMASAEDQRWVNHSEHQAADPAAALMHRYMDQVMKASLVVPEVAEVFFLVSQMTSPPTEFFRPDIVLQVFATLPSA